MKISNYNIINTIGEGGMATVYLSEHQTLGNKIAIKVLKEEFVRNQNIRKRFLAEARSMAHMSHTNIIKVTDLVDENDTVAFVMEYVEGETLKEYIDRKGKLKDHEIIDIFSQMLDALAYVHEQKLVHRDIKPSNFMIDKKGRVKLMDFGIAKTLDPSSSEYTQTGTGMQMGTPMYMSPEQIKETKNVTAQSDIYSLGVVLWSMVTGQKPYQGNTTSTFELHTKIVNEKLPATATIFDIIIEISTAKNLDERFKNCAEFRNKLEGLKNQGLVSDQNIPIQNPEATVIESPSDKTLIEVNSLENTTSKPIFINENSSYAKEDREKLIIVFSVIFVFAIFVWIIEYNRNDSYSSYDTTTYDSTYVVDPIYFDSLAVDTTVTDTVAAY